MTMTGLTDSAIQHGLAQLQEEQIGLCGNHSRILFAYGSTVVAVASPYAWQD
jgi:hypothetical protein